MATFNPAAYQFVTVIAHQFDRKHDLQARPCPILSTCLIQIYTLKKVIFLPETIIRWFGSMAYNIASHTWTMQEIAAEKLKQIKTQGERRIPRMRF